MRSWIELDATRLKQNYRILSEASQPALSIPVIKSNAYGHGFREIYSILQSERPSWLAVNYIEEGLQLRSLGYQGHVLVVGPPAPGLMSDAGQAKLDIIIGDFPSFQYWLESHPRPRVHVKIDSGMSRQGFVAEEWQAAAEAFYPERSQVFGILSHFANVEDVLQHEYARQQVAAFKEARSIFKNKGFDLAAHIASSASTLLLDDSHYNFTRNGISLYGFWPSGKTKLSYNTNHSELAKLLPVLSWYTEVALCKTIKEGQFVGYGCTYRALKDTRIAVLPVGYYEGYPRLASGRGSYVLIRGKRCPIIGRVCMNMMMVDISHLKQVEAGDRVTLIGTDGEEHISAEDLAGWSETIHYELVTRINPAIPRQVIE